MVQTPPILSKVVQVEDNAKKNTKFFSFCTVKTPPILTKDGAKGAKLKRKHIDSAAVASAAAINEGVRKLRIVGATLPLTETSLAEMTFALISRFETENANSEMNMANHDFCISSRRIDPEWLTAKLQMASGRMGVVEKLTARAEKLTAWAEKQKKNRE